MTVINFVSDLTYIVLSHMERNCTTGYSNTECRNGTQTCVRQDSRFWFSRCV